VAAATEQRGRLSAGGIVILAVSEIDARNVAAVDEKNTVVGHVRLSNADKANHGAGQLALTCLKTMIDDREMGGPPS
jgi:hypothetical protein